ncbi:MAG: phosphate acyltransferase, partial [Chthonomonas sp.]|nr:phosphate acyltransferase [Chthonomonas sp.]
MNIALDAMGGDHAPETVVEGALQALSHMEGTISLVGDPVRINALLPKPAPQRLSIVPASQVIEMDEKPTEALRKKKDSSLMVAVGMVKAGSADAVVSAGNTGAAAAAAQLAWRQMSKIHRPAIASLFPNKHGNFILLDAGASPDVDPEHLVEFAVMGRAY